MKKNILLIATGGTIASKKTEEGLAPGITSEELLSYVPEIKEFCNVDTIQLLNIDSTNIQPEYWVLMTEAIEKNYDKYDGFVISHGTDTMSYTSAALSYLIQNPDKPIVVTGSQKPINADITDAKKNLLDSFRFAAEKGVKGVYLVFDGKAIVGTRARKVKSKSYSAFESINFPVAAIIDDTRITRYIRSEHENGTVKFYKSIYPSIFLLKLVPGMEPDVLDYIGEKYEGVVIESYGVGGLPFLDKRNFLEKLGDLTEKGKIVVVATQVMFEGSDMGVYEVGVRALKQFNVLQAYDMTIEAAITKLMWIMAQTKDFDDVKEKFYTRINEDSLY
ncbi:MAG: asparaginase [Sedimentibacter saalensis]|jgi:L-asparaginase|uniref:asparaginase n=1 Tax=Sedimentibacter saalensis TaxID=130788 RepID=UPI002B2054F5|nr:asparaginase [Sedimentibacter saalensis]MEA5096338.1 asparaginase [Sedimentibacter saalensis]